jgi:hypothetical protein
LVKCGWISDGRARFAQALAGQIDPTGVVDDAVEDRVGGSDHVVPSVDGNLAGDDKRSFILAVFDVFEQLARLFGRQGPRLLSTPTISGDD